MNTYTPPVLVEYGDVSSITADSRENNTSDIFNGLNGPQEGLGGSLDTCVTPDDQRCMR